MIYNSLKFLLLSIFWIIPAMGMNVEQGIIQPFHDIHPPFITWAVSQGNFEKANIPTELRHILIEIASKDYVAARQKCVRETFMINLSLQDVLFSHKTCLDGIQILNDAKASQRYDQSCNCSKPSFTITRENYEKTLEVPFFIKMKALGGNLQKNIPSYNTISARVIIYPNLIECGGIAYKNYCLACYPSCSYLDR